MKSDRHPLFESRRLGKFKKAWRNHHLHTASIQLTETHINRRTSPNGDIQMIDSGTNTMLHTILAPSKGTKFSIVFEDKKQIQTLAKTDEELDARRYVDELVSKRAYIDGIIQIFQLQTPMVPAKKPVVLGKAAGKKKYMRQFPQADEKSFEDHWNKVLADRKAERKITNKTKSEHTFTNTLHRATSIYEVSVATEIKRKNEERRKKKKDQEEEEEYEVVVSDDNDEIDDPKVEPEDEIAADVSDDDEDEHQKVTQDEDIMLGGDNEEHGEYDMSKRRKISMEDEASMNKEEDDMMLLQRLKSTDMEQEDEEEEELRLVPQAQGVKSRKQLLTRNKLLHVLAQFAVESMKKNGVM